MGRDRVRTRRHSGRSAVDHEKEWISIMSPGICPSGGWVGEAGWSTSYFLGERSPHEGERPMRAGGGYPFHHPAVLHNVPPPTVIFNRPLRWWSMDRASRVSEALRLRDQLQMAILRLSERTH